MASLSAENISEELKDDLKVKVAGVDADGILRGKVMAKEKFLSTVTLGFGFSSAVFGWDMHDALLTSEVATAAATSGYTDIIAVADLSSFRRLPWENNMPFFLLHFHVGGKPVAACPRGIMSSITKKLAANNFKALAGGKTIICHFEDCLARFDD